MIFEESLQRYFPSSILLDEFVRKTNKALDDNGFTRENTLPCISVCRDEITRPLVTRIERNWGESFNFSSLAGMIWLGKTGFSAAATHSPNDTGRLRYIFYGMPHIAIGADGTIGQCKRIGQDGVSAACGALLDFRQQMEAGQLNLELDPDDMEQSLLKQKLFRKIMYGDIPDLIELTKITYETIFHDLEHLIKITLDWKSSDYAVITGVQIHGPEDRMYVWPGKMYVASSGYQMNILIDEIELEEETTQTVSEEEKNAKEQLGNLLERIVQETLVGTMKETLHTQVRELLLPIIKKYSVDSE